jgi:hypothetical protein
MTAHPKDLADLLAEPARAAEVPVEVIPGLMGQVAAEQARLAALEGALAARLAATAGRRTEPPEAESDLIDDVLEVGRLIRRSESWVRKHGRTLPGFHQPGGKGAKVAWSRRALQIWTNGAA